MLARLWDLDNVLVLMHSIAPFPMIVSLVPCQGALVALLAAVAAKHKRANVMPPRKSGLL